ncbi:hypothetical protein [Raineyella sp. W15-4]|uniref:hypothetical protein n=1 Tax=Raineyella sp. W15-4 TaxID=3081651 RepID=UPI00295401DB|nr:hypothetical protein [Raineyella sp. W15-4]WOQ16910.1 hypothetical protein R0145_17170 [Raineyella sp. W15-4]
MVLYLRVVALLLGQALLLGSGGPVAYASVVWVVAATGVRFGEEYVAYVRTYDAGYPLAGPAVPDSHGPPTRGI